MTGEGRLIAVGLMVVGIGFIGEFTATITSFFLAPDRMSEQNSVEERLARIESKLDELMQNRSHAKEGSISTANGER